MYTHILFNSMNSIDSVNQQVPLTRTCPALPAIPTIPTLTLPTAVSTTVPTSSSETYNSLVSRHVNGYTNTINKISRIITIAEAENAIAMDYYKNEDIVLINNIDISNPKEITKEIECLLVENNMAFPVCPQIDTRPLLKIKERTIKKMHRTRIEKIATFLHKGLWTPGSLAA
uniref:Uncharacterized protein n=1 Tax=viral metagenome TaxID=1070528 RepID=A0A6C0KWP4_9ZZZZ